MRHACIGNRYIMYIVHYTIQSVLTVLVINCVESFTEIYKYSYKYNMLFYHVIILYEINRVYSVAYRMVLAEAKLCLTNNLLFRHEIIYT